MGRLGQGMNAGVGPSRPLELHLSAEELPGPHQTAFPGCSWRWSWDCQPLKPSPSYCDGHLYLYPGGSRRPSPCAPQVDAPWSRHHPRLSHAALGPLSEEGHHFEHGAGNPAGRITA